MKRSAFVAIAIAMTMVACGREQDERRLTGLCTTPKEHCINVTIVANIIKVDNPELHLLGPNHKIYWQLNAPGYEFPRNGVVMPDDPNPEFPDCHPEHGGQIYSCKALNGKPGYKYKYTINLSGAPTVAPLDPWIYND
jgi:hypothetical protein